MNRITAVLSALGLTVALLLTAPAADAASGRVESHCQTKDPDSIWGPSITACESYSYRALSGRRIQGTALALRANRCDTADDEITHIHVRITTTRHVNRYPAYSTCHGTPVSHFHMTVPGNRARVDVWFKVERVGDTDVTYHFVFHVCRDGRC